MSVPTIDQVASDFGDRYLPPHYARWQEALAHAYFTGKQDQPVVLFVDRDELNDLADDGEDGARSLASGVRELVDIDLGSRMFAEARQIEKAWRNGTTTQPPPTLPILALSVLAASEMRSDLDGPRNAYYIRLARVLVPDAQDAEITTLLYDLRERGAFVSVALMWEQLDVWLSKQEGTFGTSTIRGDAEQTRIGYPLSQTLVRQSDRAALTRFFSSLYVNRDGVPGEEALLQMLRSWVSRRTHGFSARFVEALSDSDLGSYLMPLVHDLAKAWDGKIITPEGLQRLNLRLALDLERGTAWWVIPSVRDLAEDVLSGTCGDEAFDAPITVDPHSSMYNAHGLPRVTSMALTSGIVARGKHSVADFQPSEVMVMSDNADAGGWMSVDAVQPYEAHIFVVATNVAPATAQALRGAADPGWRKLPPQLTARMLGTGFEIFHKITFSDRRKLDAALATLPGKVAANLRLGGTSRPRLVNGLPIQRNVTRHQYLAGGEPDLVLPVGAEPRDVTVMLDGLPSRLRESIFPFPLRRLGGGFAPGTHSVEANGEVLTFEVVPRSADDRTPPGLGSLAWVDGRLQEALPGTSVCGAVTRPERIERPALARRGSSESWLLHKSGHTTELSEPPPPSFAADVIFPLFEVDLNKAAWLAQKRRSGWMITRMNPQEPVFRRLSVEDRLLWCELVNSVELDDPAWKLYHLEWERFYGR